MVTDEHGGQTIILCTIWTRGDTRIKHIGKARSRIKNYSAQTNGSGWKSHNEYTILVFFSNEKHEGVVLDIKLRPLTTIALILKRSTMKNETLANRTKREHRERFSTSKSV